LIIHIWNERTNHKPLFILEKDSTSMLLMFDVLYLIEPVFNLVYFKIQLVGSFIFLKIFILKFNYRQRKFSKL